ncbi:MAG: hypothetical protein KAG97_04920 [Victivallales bacterium]|nr:hypothetical protein [Victivallales bacterium]
MIWDEHTYLMVDYNLIEEEDNTSLVREEAYKRPDPLIRIEDKKLTLGATSLGFVFVVREGGTYRMWYEVRGVRETQNHGERIYPGDYGKAAYKAYAESDDGIHFKPVNLGQVEINGSKRNNVIKFPDGGAGAIRTCGLMHDPLDCEYPYKCVYYRRGEGKDFEPGVDVRFPYVKNQDWWYIWGIGKSRDGLEWEAPKHKHNLVNTNPEHARLHRALDGGLVLSDQMMSGVSDFAWRNVKGWITYDMETAHRIPDYLYKVPEHMVRTHMQYMGPNWDAVPWIQPHVGLTCARKGPTIVALNGYLYGCGGNKGAETFAQTADIGLCTSASGARFEDVYPFRPFIRRGERDSWDFGMVAQSCIVDNDTETRFYYTGGDVGNFSTTYLPGMAYIPRDRYGYRLIKGYRNTEKKNSEANIILKPCVLPAAPAFKLNCSHVTDTRVIRLQLTDENGKTIPGYSFSSCEPVRTEGLAVDVSWKNNRTGGELAGRKVKIGIKISSPDCGEVYYDSPRLYAIYTGGAK